MASKHRDELMDEQFEQFRDNRYRKFSCKFCRKRKGGLTWSICKVDLITSSVQ